MNKFVKAAHDTFSLSPLCTGRKKLSTIEVIDRPLTIVAFDFATIHDRGEEKNFPIILFSEIEDGYYCGGKLLYNLCQVWAGSGEDGDLETVNDELREAGGVKIKLTNSKTRDGNNLVTVEVLD